MWMLQQDTTVGDRISGCVLLILLGPLLLLVGLIILLVAGQPVLITDLIATDDGRVLRSLRFRTAGAGKPGVS